MLVGMSVCDHLIREVTQEHGDTSHNSISTNESCHVDNQRCLELVSNEGEEDSAQNCQRYQQAKALSLIEDEAVHVHSNDKAYY